MTTGRLYWILDTDLRIYAVEEDGDVSWTKLSGDHAEIRNMRKSTKQEFETMRFNEGYEEDDKTLFTIVGITIILMKWMISMLIYQKKWNDSGCKKNQRKERVGVRYMKPISIQITGPFSEDLWMWQSN